MLEKIKAELVNVMQSIQDLVHICEAEPRGDGLLAELKRQNRLQEGLISELEEELARLRMELEETKNKNVKMEKLWKTQIREEEDRHFSPRTQLAISCVDPSVSKSKI